MNLPELEIACPVCNGKKGRATGEEESGFSECFRCEGSGFIPTPLGARILELIHHNSRVQVSAELRVSSAR